MTRCALPLLLALTLPALSHAEDADATNTNAEFTRKADAAVQTLVAKGFAGCVLIERDKTVLLRKGFGFADRDAQTPNIPEMRFDLGSVTKPLVAAAVLRQIEREKFRLDSPLGELLDDVPEDKRSVTVEQLLSHTAGIPRHYELAGVDTRNRDDVVAAILKRPLAHPPGEKHTYSNANYFLLAAILEIKGGKSYEEVVRESVFDALKMTGAGFTGDELRNDERSPRRFESGESVGGMIPWPHLWGHRGATGIACDVDDLAKFARALHDDSLFGEARRADWLKVRHNHYALGWFVIEPPNRPRMILHSGAAPGARALVARFPTQRVTLVVLMNANDKAAQHEFTILRLVELLL